MPPTAQMRILVDTSVLVAALWEKQAHHAHVLDWLSRTMAHHEVVLSTHTLAELYAVLTGKAHYRPQEIAETTAWVVESFTLQPLTTEDYRRALATAAERGLTGGAIYDALHAMAAERAEADRIASGDRRSFPHLWPAAKLINPFPPAA